MSPELEDKLNKTFPTLYTGRGFEHGDGWFQIIWELSEKLVDGTVGVTVAQCKEKFGSLRFYIDHEIEDDVQVDRISEWIRESEQLSSVTCEDCGAHGRISMKGYWLITLCDECCAKNGATRKCLDPSDPFSAFK